LSFKQIGY